jgi:hypothetical protein
MSLNLILKSIVFTTVFLTGCGSTVVDFEVDLQVQLTPAASSGTGKVYKTADKIGTTFSFLPTAYEDEKLKIIFQVDDLQIKVQVENKETSPMAVLWNQATVASKYGRACQLTTFEYITDDRSRVVSHRYKILDEIVIEPLESHLSRIKPDYKKIYESGNLFSLVDAQQSIESAVDNTLIFTLPIELNDFIYTYQFILVSTDLELRKSYF